MSWRWPLLAVLVCLLVPTQLLGLSPSRVGEHVRHEIGSPHPYPSLGNPEPQLVWTDAITFEGATYIAPHFSQFELAGNDYVVVRSRDGRQRWTYRGLGRGDLGQSSGFYSTRIHGDTAVIELWSAGAETAFGYAVDHFGRGYNNDELIAMWEAGLGESLNLVRPILDDRSICTTDDKENAICYQATEPEVYERGRAISRLFISGAFLCTGWLVGDEGHMMTNEHCISSQGAASNTDYEWMAEGETCATVCPQLGCDGAVEATDATFIQDNVGLDYALLLPDTSTGAGTDLVATYGFLQLREDGAELDERIYSVQHPGGRGKEMAVFSTYPDDATGFAQVNSLVEPVCDATSNVPEVGYWMDTEGGSSGSPVFGYSDHLVIALHHCRGSNFCTSGNSATDDPNRGVPVPAIIDDLGANLPNNAIGLVGLLFADGFESGDVLAWSTSVP